MTLQEAYVRGLEDGIRAYAWMKDDAELQARYNAPAGRLEGEA